MAEEKKVIEPVVEQKTPEVKSEATPAKVETPVVKPEPVVKTPNVEGRIDNCDKLNIRVKPHPAGRVVAVLEKGTKLIIDEAKSTSDWYSVREAEGSVYGYCMKKFVTK